MATKVFDASAVAALVFGEPEAASISSLFDGGPRVSPQLLSYEMANICIVKIRRHPNTAELTRSAFGLFRDLKIEEFPVDITECLDLARRAGLTAYDASYLWLSRRMGAELVTLDKKLAAAAAS
jgi:predicted nucleic acid-binding protein